MTLLTAALVTLYAAILLPGAEARVSDLKRLTARLRPARKQ